VKKAIVVVVAFFSGFAIKKATIVSHCLLVFFSPSVGLLQRMRQQQDIAIFFPFNLLSFLFFFFGFSIANNY
jgi:hypothetical protein